MNTLFLPESRPFAGNRVLLKTGGRGFDGRLLVQLLHPDHRPQPVDRIRHFGSRCSG